MSSLSLLGQHAEEVYAGQVIGLHNKERAVDFQVIGLVVKALHAS